MEGRGRWPLPSGCEDRDLSGWSGCGKNQCRARQAESFLRGGEQALQQGPGSWRWRSDSLGKGHGSIPRTFFLGNWVWGKTPEARVMSQVWGWEAPGYIELVAMLSIQDPPGARRMERGQRPGDSCQPGRRGLSWGGVHLLQARQCMGSSGKPRGPWGSVHTDCSRWGGRARGFCCATVGCRGCGLWSLEAPGRWLL